MKPIAQARVILASSASWRSEILERAGIPHRAIAPRYEEPKYDNEPIEDFVKELALGKAHSLERDFPSAIIIAFDQLAMIGDQIMGKPLTHEKARAQLKQLKGREHSLFNSLAVLYRGKEILKGDRAKLWMRDLNDQQIENYLLKEEPYGCAASYKIEALGSALFERVEVEDINSIIGVPLNLLQDALLELGFSTLL